MLFLAATTLLTVLFYILKNSYKSLSNLFEPFFPICLQPHLVLGLISQIIKVSSCLFILYA
jgi:hypothetical protein